jgi:hypothetical protein
MLIAPMETALNVLQDVLLAMESALKNVRNALMIPQHLTLRRFQLMNALRTARLVNMKYKVYLHVLVVIRVVKAATLQALIARLVLM